MTIFIVTWIVIFIFVFFILGGLGGITFADKTGANAFIIERTSGNVGFAFKTGDTIVGRLIVNPQGHLIWNNAIAGTDKEVSD